MAMRNTALRAAKYKSLVRSGAKTNKGTGSSEQMFNGIVRDIIKGNAQREAKRQARKPVVAAQEELMNIRAHVGLPKEMIPMLAKVIAANKIPMANVYDYYKARKTGYPKSTDAEIWASFIKNSIGRARNPHLR
ncbi:MAG: hypothetical protein PHH08_01710 [Candidatus ainarchaeum sp.]|nr:hypothetical protein [Candidatus ainarchaeum sp.]